jgi:hypothetical protein
MTTISRSMSASRTIRAALTALVLGLCLALTAAPSRAGSDEDFEDFDEDGVADAVDACPDTPSSDLVGPDGCAACSCDDGPEDAGWRSRKAYVACVRGWAKGLRAAGAIDVEAGRMLVRRARRSTCGNPALVRCCVFQPFDAEVGKCRIMSEDACDALDERLFDQDTGEASSEDTGSCLPNPCTL